MSSIRVLLAEDELALGSIVKESISIGSECLIGMGQIIRKNIEKKMTISESI
jgi:hypothetical protein